MSQTIGSAQAQRSASTILLVENEVLVRMPLAEYLRECGYRVLEATTAAEAMALLITGLPVDLVFAKVKLPGGQSGFTLANWVRRHHPRIKVLLSASIANATEKAGDLCARGPMQAIPYPPGAVLRRIQSLLHRARRAGAGRGRSSLA